MKILYVFTSAGIQAGSVQNKVIEQIKALRYSGTDCRGLFFTTDETQGHSSELFDFVKVPKVPKTWFRSAKQRIEYQKTVYQYFKKHKPDCDFVYCRYPGAGKYIAKWMNLKACRVFFEHLTTEGPEIKLYAKENPFKWSLSSLLSHIEFRFFPLFLEWRYGKSIRRKAVFGISNSENIAEYENSIAGKNYVRLIGGDAVNSDAFPVRNAQTKDHLLRMIFLKGAVTSADFNGLDRLFKGMATYQGPYQLKLKLFGRNLENETRMINELGIQNMVETGDFISKNEVDELMNEIDLGVGAMGVHRKGLISTTTIKAREYFARGLPFFYGHQDPDLTGHPEVVNFCKEFPASEDPINFTDIINWYQDIIKNPDLSFAMHQYAKDNLDYTVKMKRLSDYLKTLNN